MSLQYSIENGEILISGKTFVYREALKALGARFDSEYKIWRVPHSVQAEGSIQKICKTLGLTSKTESKKTFEATSSRLAKTKAIAQLDSSKEERPSNNATDYTLSSLMGEISQFIQQKFNHPIWITAEISSLNQKNGSYFINLTEGKSSVVNRSTVNVSALLWRDVYRQLQLKLKDDLPLVLQEGVKIRAKVQVSLYKDRGQVSLSIVDVDPAYTKGELALTKERVIRELKKLQLFDLNKGVPLVQIPLKIGFITASGSRAYSDFIDQLQQSNYPGQVLFSEALMQGENCVKSVLSAFNRLLKHNPDCIVITRGGGSQADLLWFDDLELCKQLAKSPVPIIAAIGHHDDNNVLEMVAHTREKTPTAAAEHLIEKIRQAKQGLESNLTKLKQGMAKYLSQQEKKMQNLRQRISHSSIHRLEMQLEKANGLKLGLKNAAINLMQHESLALSKLENRITKRDPKPWLKNGWTQLYIGKNKIKRMNEINVADTVVAALLDGSVSMEVKSLKERKHVEDK